MAGERSDTTPERVLLFALALTLVYFTGFFPPGDNPNELSRIQALTAFGEDRTFVIDRWVAQFGDHMDKSVSGGHYYSNKAPGLVFAAIPVYEALRLVFPPPRSGTATIFVLVRLCTVSLAAAVALAVFARRLASYRRPGGGASLAAVAVAFGTPFFYYARSFFSHAWTAALLYLSWELLRAAEAKRGVRASATMAAAGLLAGFATISEYPVAVIAIVLAARAAWGGGFRALLPFAAGAAPALALLLAYDAACFGSPWVLSSAREAHPDYAALSHRGMFGLGLPAPRTAWRLLFHPSRGALLFSPFLLWAIAGAVRWWRSGRDRKDCVVAIAAPALLFVAMAGYPNWEGGWSLGSRYLLPALFFVGLPLVHALESFRSRALFLAACTFSVAHLFLLGSTWPHIPPTMAWPAATFSFFLVRGGGVAPNLGTYAGLSPIVSLLVPLAAVGAALAVAASRLEVPHGIRGRAAALGAAVLAATIVFPPRVPDWDRQWRVDMLRMRLEAARSGYGVGRRPAAIIPAPP